MTTRGTHNLRGGSGDDTTAVMSRELKPELMSLSRGEKLGPSEILAPIEAGGMGEMYRAHDPRLAAQIARRPIPVHGAGEGRSDGRHQRRAQLKPKPDRPWPYAACGCAHGSI